MPRQRRPLYPEVQERRGLDRFKVFDALVTLVAVLDLEGRLVFVNSVLEDALGMSRKTLAGRYFPDMLAQADPMLDVLQNTKPGELSGVRYDTTLVRFAREPLPVHVSVTQGADETVMVELLPLELQTRQDREERLNEQAQSNKELVRNLAHEIKNPLGGIRGAAQLLQLEFESAAMREYTEVIIHEADRLQALVDRLLAPHRRPHVVSDLNIHEICERVRALIAAQYPSGLKIVQDYDSSLPEFRGDREQLIQAVLNIAQNACQAMQQGIERQDAVLTLRTRIARQVTLGKQRYRLALELHVIDNGPGVPEDLRDRIFYPLVSGREGGSGLGLTLAQTFVQQHLGSIDCDSTPGLTDFKILIPLT